MWVLPCLIINKILKSTLTELPVLTAETSLIQEASTFVQQHSKPRAVSNPRGYSATKPNVRLLKENKMMKQADGPQKSPDYMKRQPHKNLEGWLECSFSGSLSTSIRKHYLQFSYYFSNIKSFVSSSILIMQSQILQLR